MYLLLAILVELGSVAGTVALSFQSAINCLLEISKCGYRVKEEDFKALKEKYEKEEKNKPRSIPKDILNGLLVFTPGVNLLWAGIKNITDRKKMINYLKKENVLIPLTDDEKKQYARIKDVKSKLAFTVFASEKKHDEQEFFMVLGDKVLISDSGLMTMYNNRLEPLDYTLDEVKKLNEVTNYSYRIGKIDNDYTAIIGIPNPDFSVKRISFKSEDYRINHDYVAISEEEAQDKKFTVYSDTISDEKEMALANAIEEIKKDRLAKTETDAVVRIANSSLNDYNVMEEEGPVLRKTIGSR